MKADIYQAKSFLSLLRITVFLIGAAMMLSMLAAPAFAAKKKDFKGADGTLELALCRSMIDKDNPRDESINNKEGNNCCSKEYGYCIVCLKATPDVCTRWPYIRISRTPIAPKGDVVAPTNPIPLIKKKIRNNNNGTTAN
jgi:hypothetical protein